ncbi:MAG TPA: Holliday junction resolvase RuvX [Acidimicrobiia bacterium]
MRVLGVDLGSRRIGLARSDASGALATPLTVLERASDHAADHAGILAVAAAEGVARIVVGLPLSMSGAEGPAARAARAEVDELRAATSLPVDLHDERLTTVSAERRLRESRRGRAKRDPVDAAAAAEMLQSFLDATSARSSRRAALADDPARRAGRDR